MLTKFFFLLGLILMVAYFAGIETAVLSLSSSDITRLKEKSKKFFKYLTLWENEPNSIIATILIGTNLAMIAAGVVSGSIAVDINQKFLFPAIVTISVLLFGEIIPKVYSRYHSESVTKAGIMPLNFFSKLLKPVSLLLVGFVITIMKFFKIHSSSETSFLTKEELSTMLKLDNELLTSSARNMLRNILSFGDRKIHEVMVKREEIFSVDFNEGLEKIVHKVISSKFSRIPIYKGSIDNIVGVIYTKDLIIAERNKNLYVLEDIIRPAYFVKENISVNELLKEFKSGRQHMAIVKNEQGSIVGLVTIEDLVEEIVGEIYDEYDLK